MAPQFCNPPQMIVIVVGNMLVLIAIATENNLSRKAGLAWKYFLIIGNCYLLRVVKTTCINSYLLALENSKQLPY